MILNFYEEFFNVSISTIFTLAKGAKASIRLPPLVCSLCLSNGFEFLCNIFLSAELTAKGTKVSIKQNKFAASGLCNLLKLISNLQEDWKKLSLSKHNQCQSIQESFNIKLISDLMDSAKLRFPGTRYSVLGQARENSTSSSWTSSELSFSWSEKKIVHSFYEKWEEF